ncbi:MAG: hypothetical protein WA117_21945 [Verrucomicrobiia bacterium]
MSATTPKKLAVSLAVRAALAAVTDAGGSAFFKTVKRGSKVLEGDPRPAVTFKRKGWQSEPKGTTDEITTVAHYQINVLIDNPGTNEAAMESAYETAIAAAETAMETINNGRTHKTFRAFPQAGVDDVADEQLPQCAASLLYEIRFDRPRGEP